MKERLEMKEIIYMLSIPDIKELITPICKQYGIERAYLFGSYARGDAKEGSDVDLRIDRGALTGLKFCGFYVDIEDALQCNVDILTTEQLKPQFLHNIQKDEVLLYG